jgi:hypothetical protein
MPAVGGDASRFKRETFGIARFSQRYGHAVYI